MNRRVCVHNDRMDHDACRVCVVSDRDRLAEENETLRFERDAFKRTVEAWNAGMPAMIKENATLRALLGDVVRALHPYPGQASYIEAVLLPSKVAEIRLALSGGAV